MSKDRLVAILGCNNLNITSGRMKEGLGLLKEGTNTKFLLTGTEREVNAMISVINQFNPKGMTIRVDKRSKNTFDNAYYSKLVCLEDSINDILIVTSRFHIKRAIKIFKKVFGKEYSTDHIITNRRSRANKENYRYTVQNLH